MKKMMIILQEMAYLGFSKLMENIKADEYLPYEIRIEKQNIVLRKLISHAFNNVPYYRDLSKNIGVEAGDIRNISDLKKLPILTREDLKLNIDKFRYKEKGAISSRTGGSTGQPLKFEMSRDSNYRGRALLYNGWSRGGYMRGDKILFFAGGSLVGKPSFKSRLINFFMNAHLESSSSVTDEKLQKICEWISVNRPKYIRGYASSLSLLAEYFYKNGYKPKGILACYTTSEPLFPAQREIINKAFDAEVFDNYGLNDGGVSAFECEAHNGMHIDTQRAIMEICNWENDNCSFGEEGRIIATDLYNYAFPFIRYDTGDLGIIDDSPCICRRTSPRLVKITGRTADVLKFQKHSVNGNVLTVLMGKTNVDLYKIVQKDLNKVEVHLLFADNNRIHRLNSCNECEKLIKQFFYENAPEVEVLFYTYFSYNDFPRAENKLKFIVNEYIRE